MIDRAEIHVRAGSGGYGAISFRHEKFVPFGGPDGGDGGRGGDVIIRADGAVDSLRRYRQKRSYRAENGKNGAGGKKHGRNGDNVVLTVPTGTVVSRNTEGTDADLVADLEHAGDEAVVARGGGGGLGNTHFASSTNQAPRIAQRGEPGEEHTLLLEMRIIADVGIIGYPNVGKSTLLAAASAAKPRIANYPFTTIEPVLGVVEVGQETFVMAEIPGLVEGAHLGRGLGHDFLRHILRTRILIHVLSADSSSPVEDLQSVNAELALFDPSLPEKPQVVALNKIDLPEVTGRLAAIKESLKNIGIRAYAISAANATGVTELMSEAMRVLKETLAEEKPAQPAIKVFRPQPRESRIMVSKEGEEYVITAPGLERMVAGDGVSPAELRWQLSGQLERMGINKALKKAGIKRGDKVRCGELKWEW